MSSFLFSFFLCFAYLFALNNAQMLLLAYCSGATPSSVWGTLLMLGIKPEHLYAFDQSCIAFCYVLVLSDSLLSHIHHVITRFFPVIVVLVSNISS